MKNQNEVREALKKDPIAKAEGLLGKRHEEMSDNEKELAMALFIQENRKTKEILKKAEDTYFGIEWNDFKAILDEQGFTVAFRNNFGEKEEELLLVNSELGLIVFAESYDGKRINTATLHGEVYSKEEVTFTEKKNEFWGTTSKVMNMTPSLKSAYRALDRCSHDAFSGINEGVHFSYDCREGFVTKMNELKEHFLFNKKWNKKPFLWFLNYNETTRSSDNYRFITEGKIEKSSEELKNIFSKIK